LTYVNIIYNIITMEM